MIIGFAMVLLPATTTTIANKPLNALGLGTITIGLCILLYFVYKHLAEVEQKKNDGGRDDISVRAKNEGGGLGGKMIPVPALASKRRV